MIFNAVLEQIMRRVKSKWLSKKYGFQIGYTSESILTNLRFADDIVLIGRSLPQIKQMIADVSIESARVGLQLHLEKTKNQHNDIGYGSCVRSAQVAGMSIEVLGPQESAMYLGRALSLTEPHDIELKHRLKKAWAKFGTFKQELTDLTIPLHLRLKLFQSVLTPTVLYGCSSWVMTCTREAALRTTQRKMLRAMLGRKRLKKPCGGIETWVEWIQRVTDEVVKIMQAHNIPDWTVEQRSRQQKWGERLEDLAPERWAKRVFRWQPEGCRSRGHPRTRWADQLILHR